MPKNGRDCCDSELKIHSPRPGQLLKFDTIVKLQ